MNILSLQAIHDAVPAVHENALLDQAGLEPEDLSSLPPLVRISFKISNWILMIIMDNPDLHDWSTKE